MFKRIIKDTSLSAFGTLISRFLGFIRDVLLAYFFGTAAVLEAFLVAFRLPNLFRDVLGEGFSDSITVPVLAEYHQDQARIFSIGRRLLSLFFIVLCFLTLLGIIFSKYLVMIIAPGFLSQPDKFNLTVSFTRITFFYIFLIGFSVNMNSILYALRKFFIPSLTPAFLNVSFIAGIIFFSRIFADYTLVVCVVAAGVIQIIFPYIFLKKEGFNFKFSFAGARRDPAVIRMIKLFPARVWSSATYHLNVIIDTVLCSLSGVVGPGALAAVHFSNRLIQLPLALFVLPLVRVIIVDLSAYHKEEKWEDFKKLFVFSFQNIIFFIIPITVIYLAISRGIIDVIFRHGEFSAYSLSITARAFFFYSFGLFFFCAIKVLLSAFYALKDTYTPAKTTAVCLLLNAALSVLLMFPLGVGGVALGSSLAAAVNFVMLYLALVKKIGKIEWADTKSQFLKVFILSVTAGGISRWLWESFTFCKYFKILIIAAVIGIIFLGVGSFLGLKQIEYIRTWLRRR